MIDDLKQDEIIRVLSDQIIKEEVVASEGRKELEQMIELINNTKYGNLGCFNAFIAGFISQEVIKGITNKYMPTNQFVYFDCLEIIKDVESVKNVKVKKDRLDGLRLCLGEELVKTIQDTRLFMVGSGAIGCELLKNYAMMSLGTGNQ